MGTGRATSSAAEAPRVAEACPWPGEEQNRPGPARESPRWGWIESGVLAAYAAVVATGIAFHEPWADEAQAWMLGRDNGWWELMWHRIRYEGSPGLWHSLMWLMARLHFGYAGMHWVTGAIAVAGVWVLLRWSPFPAILRILLPLGFWLAYQDAVVARSYSVFAILAFPAAALLRGGARDGLTKKRLMWLAIVCGLMANLSVHGFVASAGFALATLAVARRQRSRGAPVRLAGAALVLGCFWLFMAVTVFPPSDVDFPAGKNLETSSQRIWAKLGSQSARTELQVSAAQAEKARPGELAAWVAPKIHKTPQEALWHKIARILSLFTFPVSNFRYLALAACILIIAQGIVFRRAGGEVGWTGLLPWLLMILVFTSMYLAPRHAGMLWEALVASLWLTWPSEPVSKRGAIWLRRITLAVLVLIGLNQLGWTAHALRDEIYQPYSGDEATAQWLKAHAAGKRIAGFGYHSIGVEGWFRDRIYFNQPAAYWIWSTRWRVNERAPFAIATHPDVIVFGGWDSSPHNAALIDDWLSVNPEELNRLPLNDLYRIVPYAEAHGYRVTHRFCGHAFMRYGYSEELCQLVLQPAGAVGQGSAQASHPAAGLGGKTTVR